jgi:DNA polymerase I-like protein with 3'-5' exonuclease and polymerase domains
MIDALVLDFETKDPFLGLKMGSGWVYTRGNHFKVLGMAVIEPNGKQRYIKTKQSIINCLNKYDTYIVFNANYDIGIVHRLGVDLSNKTIIDVEIMAKMNNSTEERHNLNHLSKKYLGSYKSDAPLGEVARELGLVKSSTQSAIGVAKENMDKIQEANPELVAEYAIQDVVLTQELYELFKEVDGYDIEFYSDLIKALIQARAKGVTIDLIQLLKLDAEFQIKIMDAQLHLNKMNGGNPVNSSSPQDVPQFLIANGHNLEMNEKGNGS